MYDVADTLKRINFSDDFICNSFYYNRIMQKGYATDAVYSVEDFFRHGLGDPQADRKAMPEK